MTTASKVFVRDATGVVRAISPLNALILTSFNIAYGLSMSLALTTTPAVLPGADIGVAFLLAFPFVISIGLLYTWFTISMPRAGAEYVWISRTINPAIAIGFAFLFVFFQSVLMGSLANFDLSYILAAGLASLGVLTGSTALMGFSAFLASANAILLFGTLLVLLTFVLLVTPLRYYLRVQQVLYVLGIMSMIVFFFIIGTTNRSQFVASFNDAFGTYNATYDGIISAANSLGFANPGLVTFGSATLLAIPFLLFTLNGFQWAGYMGGELKDVGKGMYLSAVFGGTLVTLIFAASGFLTQQVMGAEFLNAVSYLQTAAPAQYPLPVPFNALLIAVFLGRSVPLGVILVVGVFAWGFGILVAEGLVCSRIILALGFDRALPAKLAEVSDRFHTPVVAATVYAILLEVGLVASVYAGVIFAQINVTLVVVLLYAFIGLAALVFPYWRKDLFQASPIARYRIGGVPAISLLGAVDLVLFSVLVYFALSYPSLSGPTGPTALALLVAVFVIGVVSYYATRAYYKGKGIPVDLAFAQIPPE